MSGAILSPVIADGTISALTITNAGSGYSSVPTISINPPTVQGGTQATATCTLSGGSIISITMTNNGTDYDVENPPLVSVIVEIVEGLNISSLSTDILDVSSSVNTLQGDFDVLDSVVSQNSGNISTLDSTVSTLTPVGWVDGSVLFTGAVGDILADTDQFIYDRLNSFLTVENPIQCRNASTLGTEYMRKSEIDTLLTTKQDVLTNQSNVSISSLTATSITLTGSISTPDGTVSNNIDIGGDLIARSDVQFPNLANGTQSNVLYFNTSDGNLTYGSAPSFALSPTQATFGFISTVTYANNYSWETVKFNKSTISIPSLTYSNGEFSIPAGTFIFDFHHPLSASNTTQRVFAFQSGSSVSPSNSFLTLQVSTNAQGQYNRAPHMSYTYVFSTTTAFRMWTSGGSSDTSGASSGQYQYRQNNLLITKLA